MVVLLGMIIFANQLFDIMPYRAFLFVSHAIANIYPRASFLIWSKLGQLAINKALMEEKEAEEGSEDELGEDVDDEGATLKDEQFISTPVEVASAAPRSRNRPKREA